jgi:hypothetical protein
MKLRLPITSLVEVVRVARIPRSDADLGLRVTGSSLDHGDCEMRVVDLVGDIMDGLDAPTGVEAVLVVRDGVVLHEVHVAAWQHLADLAHLLREDEHDVRHAFDLGAVA